MVKPWLKRSQVQSLLLLSLFAFFLAHFILLSPSGLEEDFNGVRVIHPRDLLNFLKNEPDAIAKNVPTNVAPSYSIRGMNFFSSRGPRPDWKMISRKSNVYQAQQLIHSRDAQLELPDGTRLNAKEMAMRQDEDRTELYQDVVVYLPNGLSLKTEYAEVKGRPKLFVTIPLTEKVIGHRVERGTELKFESYGLTYSEADHGDLRLLSRVQVWIQEAQLTHIQSDYALYQPPLALLNFQMFDSQPLEKQFVQVNQPDLSIRSRSLENQLSQNGAGNRQLERITALGDVKLEDRHDPEHVATGTSGKAIFYQGKNEIHLTDFPQVYQDGDTITGDVIVFNRNRDTIEVKQSNAIYHR